MPSTSGGSAPAPAGSTSATERSGEKYWYSGALPGRVPFAFGFGGAVSRLLQPVGSRVARICCISGLRLPSTPSPSAPFATNVSASPFSDARITPPSRGSASIGAPCLSGGETISQARPSGSATAGEGLPDGGGNVRAAPSVLPRLLVGIPRKGLSLAGCSPARTVSAGASWLASPGSVPGGE